MNSRAVPYRVLIADDDPAVRMLVSEVLDAEQIAVCAVEDGEAALASFHAFRPDLMLLDVLMPGLDGCQVCARLRRLGLPEEFPIILMTGNDDEPGVARAYAAGATYFFTKPISWTLLPHRIKYFLRAADAARGLREALRRAEILFKSAAEGILLIDAETHRFHDANPAMCDLLGYTRDALLSMEWTEIVPAEDAAACMECLERCARVESGRVEGLTLRRKDGSRFHADISHNRMTLDGRLGIACFFVDVTEKRIAEQALMHRATHDPLTGLPNRGLLMERLTQALKQAQRRKNAGVALLFLDLDRFKPVNDLHGHAVGDELLKGVAERLRQAIRDEDTVARFGGDEFVVLMPSLDEDTHLSTQLATERILLALRSPFAVSVGDVLIGASIGIAIAPHDAITPDALIQSADQAMYRAKGGNVTSS